MGEKEELLEAKALTIIAIIILTIGVMTVNPSITLFSILELDENDIDISLQFKSGSEYDPDDNGIETKNGIVDLTVQNSSFGQGIDSEELCTKWTVLNKDEEKSTSVCFGESSCCAFIDLTSTSGKWDDIFYVNYGKYGAGEKNIVSSQIIYYNDGSKVENDNKKYNQAYEEEESIVGGSLVNRYGNKDIIVTCLGKDAAYKHKLYLDNNNQFICNSDEKGKEVNLGKFPKGTEMVFRLDVKNTGKTYYTGNAERNPDNIVHVRIKELGKYNWEFGFEDLFNGGDFDFNDCMFKVKEVTGEILEDDKKITICHYPPGNPANKHTLEISINAWSAHKAHGDTKGSCIDDEIPILDIYNSEIASLNVTFIEELLAPPKECEGSPSEIEVCDGKDNDCDGEIDEDVTRECGETDIGVCNYGIETCEDGFWGKCEGSVEPDIEECDGKDNDCDGEIDEELVQSCGTEVGQCVEGTQTCYGGEWGLCNNDYIGPVEEVCDGIDNDCDGDTDEIGCACINGETQSCGTDEGQCQKGVQECLFGQWSDCNGAIEASEESCDGIDNDCDGTIDDVTRECGDYFLGICEKGTQICSEGVWASCFGTIEPEIEECNNLDDDCDGTIDESLTRQCSNGDYESCIRGEWTGCEEVIEETDSGSGEGDLPESDIGKLVQGTKVQESFSPGQNHGINLEIIDAPELIDVNDHSVSLELEVENVGKADVYDVIIEGKTSAGWEINPESIGIIEPGEKETLIVNLKSTLCSFDDDVKVKSLKRESIDIRFDAEERLGSEDSEETSIPLNIPEFSMAIAENDYSTNPKMKTCFFVDDRDDVKEKHEIEFELYDQKNDIIVDLIGVKDTEDDNVLIKSKVYNINKPLDNKAYSTRAYLFESGELFSRSHIVGRATAKVDLSEFEKQGFSLKELFSKR